MFITCAGLFSTSLLLTKCKSREKILLLDNLKKKMHSFISFIVPLQVDTAMKKKVLLNQNSSFFLSSFGVG